MSNYYEILGIGRDATTEQIKEAWRSKIKEHHPDVGGDENVAKEINKAYEVLSDPQERAAYDNPKQPHGPGFPPGFNPFGGHGFGFNGINLNEMFARMGGVGGQSFHFTAHTQINQEVNVTLLDVILQNEVEIDIPAIGKKIQFKIPADFRDGTTYTLRIGDDKAKNQGNVLLQIRLNLVMPKLSSEKKEKLKEILSDV
jgi:DnaJ-class molecular chaperone